MTIVSTQFNVNRSRVRTPDGRYHRGRFVFVGHRAAVWRVDNARQAFRLAYTDQVASFIKRPNSRTQHILTLTDGTEWRIEPRAGGCGTCSGNPLAGYTWEQLVDPELTEVRR